MILEPLINNTLQFEIKNKEQENKVFERGQSTEKDRSKHERIFANRKECLSLHKNVKEKNGVKLNLYFCVLIIFLLGIIIGSIAFRMFIEDALVKEMIIEKFSVIENEQLTDEEIFKESLSRNIKILAIFWIVGISVVGAPLLVLLCFYKGFTTAFVISSFLLKFGFIQGNIYIFEKLFLYYIFLIFAIIILTVSSVKVTINVLKHKKDIRLELVRHSIFTILGLIFMIVSSLIETRFLKIF